MSASVTIHQHANTYTRVDALHVTGPEDRWFLVLKLGDDISIRLFGNDADGVAYARAVAWHLAAAADRLEETLKQPPAVDASDPHATDQGNPSQRDKNSS